MSRWTERLRRWCWTRRTTWTDWRRDALLPLCAPFWNVAAGSRGGVQEVEGLRRVGQVRRCNDRGDILTI